MKNSIQHFVSDLSKPDNMRKPSILTRVRQCAMSCEPRTTRKQINSTTKFLKTFDFNDVCDVRNKTQINTLESFKPLSNRILNQSNQYQIG